MSDRNSTVPFDCVAGQGLVKDDAEVVVLEQFARCQWMHAAFRQVEVHQIFVGGPHALHGELLELHARGVYPRCYDSAV